MNDETITVDIGAARETRVRLCSKRAWCIENEHHDGPCIEVPREKLASPTFSPKAKR